MDTASIFWGLLFGSIGAGYFIYGKKQGKPVPLLCGIALAVSPTSSAICWAWWRWASRSARSRTSTGPSLPPLHRDEGHHVE